MILTCPCCATTFDRASTTLPLLPPPPVLGADEPRPSSDERCGATPMSRVHARNPGDVKALVGDVEFFVAGDVYRAWRARLDAAVVPGERSLREEARTWFEASSS